MSLETLTGSRAWILAGWTMLHFLWVGAVLGVVGAVLRRLSRRASPERRYALALACLGTLALAPVGIAVILSRQVEPTSGILEVAVVGAAGSDLAAQTPRPLDLAALPTPPGIPSLPASRWDGRRLAGWAAAGLPWVWVLGAPATFALLATGLAGAERLRRASRPLSETVWNEKVREMSCALGIAREVALAACDRVASPMLVGVIRPLILLPASALSGWTPEELEMALLHELAHVRRRDNLVNLVQRLIESALFFHPAVWAASRWVRLEREHCCDRLVVSRTGRARPYAELLASLASQHAPARMSPAAAMAEAPVVDRIRQILSPNPFEDRPMPVAPPLLAVCAALILTPAALVVAQAVVKAPAADAKSDPPKVDRALLDRMILQVRRGAEVFDGLEQRAYALSKVAKAQARVGDRAAAEATFREAVGLAEKVRLDESRYAGHILQWIVRDERDAGFRDRAIADLGRLFPILEGDVVSDAFLKASVCEEIKTLYEAMGDPVGVAKAEAALKKIRPSVPGDAIDRALDRAFEPIQARIDAGDLAGALEYVRTHDFEKIVPFERYPSVRSQFLMQIAGQVRAGRGKGDEAVLAGIRSDIAAPIPGENLGSLMPRSDHLSAIADAFVRLGAIEEAMKTAGMIVSDASGAGMPPQTIEMLTDGRILKGASAYGNIGKARLAAGDRKGAVAGARAAVAVTDRPGREGYKSSPRGEAIELLAKAGEVEEALEMLSRCTPESRVGLCHSIAEIQRSAGDDAGARKTLMLGIAEIWKILRAAAKPDSKPGTVFMNPDQLRSTMAYFQALLGDVAAGKETISQIQDQGMRHDAYGRMAEALASSGDYAGAVALAGEIGDTKKKADAFQVILAILGEASKRR